MTTQLEFGAAWPLVSAQTDPSGLIDPNAGDRQPIRARFRKLLEKASVPMWHVDRKGNILFRNERFIRIFGYTDSDVTTLAQWWKKAVPDSKYRRWVIATWEEGIQRAVSGGRDIDPLEYRVACKNGEQRVVEISGITLGDGFLATFMDLTERKRAEAALVEREEQLALYAKHSPAAIAMLDRDMKYLVVSQRWRDRLGDQPLIGRSHYEMFPDMPKRWLAAHKRCLEGSIEKCDEDCIRRADGTVEWLRWEIRPWRRADDTIGGIIIFSEDITKRREADLALKLFRELIDRSSDSIQVADPATGRFLDVNESAFRSLGYTRDEMLALTMFDVTVGLDRAMCKATDAKMKAEGHATLEVSHRRKDGTTYPVEVRLSLVTLDREYLVAIVRDITERQQKTNELQWRTALMEAQVDATLDGILVVDGQKRKILQNQQLLRLFAVPDALACDKDDGKLLRHIMGRAKNPDEFAARLEYMQKHPEEISRDEIELVDGTVLDRYSSPVRDKAGKFYGRIWTFRDITKNRRLEEQLRQAQKMEAIGQLAGGVAHDFNNILGAMIMQTELTEASDNVSERVKEGLAEIRSSAERAADLTRQLLLFSSKQVMEPQNLDLNEVVTHMAKMLRRIIGEDVRLQLELHPKPLATLADAGMIHQVLMNLTVNARDAMPGGGKLIIQTGDKVVDEALARLNPDAEPGRYVSIVVRDTGTGIPPEVLPRIFEPFFTTKEMGKGTGLGLATVFGIVKQHRGWIEVKSGAGKGTAFHIYLPACGTAAATPAKAKPRTKSPGGTETILLVEDEQAVRGATRSVLMRAGYKVVEASSGVEALRIWEKHHDSVHLLLTDIVMPDGVSGIELATRLQARKKKLRVIFVSGYSAETAGREFTLKQGQNFIRKPCSARQLLEIVRQCLDG